LSLSNRHPLIRHKLGLMRRADVSTRHFRELAQEVAAPEGIRRVNARHPGVQIYTASVDRGLDDHGYILPGLGDAGDKIFGTKQKERL